MVSKDRAASSRCECLPAADAGCDTLPPFAHQLVSGDQHKILLQQRGVHVSNLITAATQRWSTNPVRGRDMIDLGFWLCHSKTWSANRTLAVQSLGLRGTDRFSHRLAHCSWQRRDEIRCTRAVAFQREQLEACPACSVIDDLRDADITSAPADCSERPPTCRTRRGMLRRALTCESVLVRMACATVFHRGPCLATSVFSVRSSCNTRGNERRH